METESKVRSGRQCSLFNLEGIGNGILGVKGRGKRFLPHGGVAQLGEHLPCKQGVVGSNPFISTKGSRKGPEQLNGLIAQAVRARA